LYWAAGPAAAITRFSPVSGTRSAIVPRQATRRNDSSGSVAPETEEMAWLIFSAMPAAESSLQG
jgi:hypothetical protein